MYGSDVCMYVLCTAVEVVGSKHRFDNSFLFNGDDDATVPDPCAQLTGM